MARRAGRWSGELSVRETSGWIDVPDDIAVGLIVARFSSTAPVDWIYPPGGAPRTVLGGNDPPARWLQGILESAREGGRAVVEVWFGVPHGIPLPPTGARPAVPLLPGRPASFLAALVAAGKGSAPVNLSNFGHREITEGLNNAIFKQHGLPASLPVIYGDGTQPPAFPIPALDAAPVFDKRPVLSLVLVSNRHPMLDAHADLALLRNSEITPDQTMAEQDELTTDAAQTVLRSPGLSRGGLIHVWQTGLEPVVTGFYRAVVANLQSRASDGCPPLTLVPWFWRRAEVPCPAGLDMEALELLAPKLLKAFDRRGKRRLAFLPERPILAEELSCLETACPAEVPTWNRLAAATQYESGSPWSTTQNVMS